jgi:hypothetical protein
MSRGYSRALNPMLSEPGLEGVYQTAYKDCAFDGKRLPPGRGDSAARGGAEGVADVNAGGRKCC